MSSIQMFSRTNTARTRCDYLMSDMVTGKDSDFSEERLVQRFNTDLANSVGNLLNRTLNMTQRYRAGKLSGLGPGHFPHISAYEGEMRESFIHWLLWSALTGTLQG